MSISRDMSVMDPASQNASASNQKQAENSSPSFNSFMNGVQSYANLDSANNHNDFDFSAGWDSNLFTANNDQPSNFLQNPNSSSNFGQNDARLSKSPSLPQYGNQHPSFMPSAYTQTQFDPRQLSQPSWDPRFYQRPTPSPGPYPGYSLPPSMNYGRHDQSLHSPQSFPAHNPPLQPRPQSTPTPPYPNHHPTNSYFNHYGLQGLPMAVSTSKLQSCMETHQLSEPGNDVHERLL